MSMRAADADRERYVELLQQAFVEGRLSREEHDERIEAAYKATTFAELTPLLLDLPIDPARLPTLPIGALRPTVPLGQVPQRRVVGQMQVDESPIVAVFAQAKRNGRWGVPPSQVAVAVFGSVTVDLREAMLSVASTQLKVSAIFGEVTVLVPDDIRVDVAGTGVFGEYKRVDDREESLRGGQPATDAPFIKVTGAAVFGTVSVIIVSSPTTGSDRELPRADPGPASPPPELPPATGGVATPGA